MSGGQGMVNKCAKCAWSGYRPGKKTCQTGMLEREREREGTFEVSQL